jgi:hypothetical protein
MLLAVQYVPKSLGMVSDNATVQVFADSLQLGLGVFTAGTTQRAPTNITSHPECVLAEMDIWVKPWPA